jgi:hypothetical protein
MNKTEIFNYLYDLRDSGVVNMWGSPAYLEDRFGMSRSVAVKWFTDWVAFVEAQGTRDNPLRNS